MTTPVPDVRPLTEPERRLVAWLLQHGSERSLPFLAQLPSTTVVSRCSCGCASIDFAVAGRTPSPEGGIEILADFRWDNADGHLFGAFVFARHDLLAGLEVWSIDGQATPSILPTAAQLRPIDQ